MAVDVEHGTVGGGGGDEQGKASFFYNPVVRAVFAQVLLLGLIAWLGYVMVKNTSASLERAHIASGFGFLKQTAGFGIIQSLVTYTEESSYGRTFIVGLLNTILISVIGIIFATMIGFLVGVARLSKNWLISRISYIYIEVMRNIPLLLHIFIWYFAVLRSVPGKREKWSFLDTIHLNIQGIWAPRPIPHDGFWLTVAALIIGLVAAFFMSKWARKRQEATGQTFPVFWVSMALMVALPLVVFFLSGGPLSFEHPVFKTEGSMLRRGFQQDVGINIIPEFLALLFALSIYTASYIAEIVRAGILAVSHGQTEAAHALGLRPGQTLRLVVIPQALRVIIPPLTNQYLNLTKNSSLAVAIAYPDLVSVFAGTTLNQTGQAIEILLMTMGVYLTLSLLISMIMNWYNARIALVER